MQNEVRYYRAEVEEILRPYWNTISDEERYAVEKAAYLTDLVKAINQIIVSRIRVFYSRRRNADSTLTGILKGLEVKLTKLSDDINISLRQAEGIAYAQQPYPKLRTLNGEPRGEPDEVPITWN